MIYLDYAATAPLRKEALEAMTSCFAETFANPSASYGAARSARQALEQAKNRIAQSIGAKRGEIFLTSGGTEADNWALLGAAAANPQKRRIVTTAIEHHAVLRACAVLERRGWEIVYLQPDHNGVISVQSAENAITQDTALVSVMLANNEVGTIEPVAEIAAIAHERGCLMHTDAVQAVGHIPVDVQQLNVDLLSMAAHKFGGPKGAGTLYIRAGTRIEPMITGGEQERGLRAGTENVPGAVGMASALVASVDEMNREMARVSVLRDLMERELHARIPWMRVNGADAQRLPGILHISLQGQESSAILTLLDMAGVAASAGSACAAGALERSHVLRAMYPDEGHTADLRFSLGRDTTQDEVYAAVGALARILDDKGVF